MGITNWKQAAKDSLRSQASQTRAVELIFTGTLVGAQLVIGLVQWLLSLMVGDVGGIGGLGVQTMVSTVTVVLQVLLLVLLPFWKAGRDSAMLEVARTERIFVRHILLGLRQWKKVLSSTLLVGLRFGATLFLASFLAEQIFLITPLAGPVYTAALEGGDVEAAMAELTGQYLLVLIPVIVIMVLPLMYRYRHLSFLVMDQELGGPQAVLACQSMTRFRRWKLAKLDLSFWWYQLPVLSGIGLMVLPHLMAALELTLPVHDLVFTLAGAVLVLGMDALAGHRVRVTYAHCYEAYAASNETPKERPAPRPEDLPWDGWH